jgi:hypothetical protein
MPRGDNMGLAALAGFIGRDFAGNCNRCREGFVRPVGGVLIAPPVAVLSRFCCAPFWKIVWSSTAKAGEQRNSGKSAAWLARRRKRPVRGQGQRLTARKTTGVDGERDLSAPGSIAFARQNSRCKSHRNWCLR